MIDEPMGAPTGHYLDPEFEPEWGLACWRDGYKANSIVWVGALDKETGLFTSGNGRDFRADNRLTPIRDRYDNGPEWIWQNGLPAVYYTNLVGGVRRLMLWSLANRAPSRAFPYLDDVHRDHCLGTQLPTGHARILYRRQAPGDSNFRLYWLDLGDPTTEHPLPTQALVAINFPVWVDKSHLLYTALAGGYPAEHYEIFHYNVDTATPTQITPDDGWHKLGGWPWDGDRRFVCAARQTLQGPPTMLRVYQYLHTSPATLVRTITAPPEARTHTLPRSPETYWYDGVPFVSFVLWDGVGEGSIWIARGDVDEPPVRVDDPAVGGLKIDPEVAVMHAGPGDWRANLYYYITDDQGSHLRRVIL